MSKLALIGGAVALTTAFIGVAVFVAKTKKATRKRIITMLSDMKKDWLDAKSEEDKEAVKAQLAMITPAINMMLKSLKEGGKEKVEMQAALDELKSLVK